MGKGLHDEHGQQDKPSSVPWGLPVVAPVDPQEMVPRAGSIEEAQSHIGRFRKIDEVCQSVTPYCKKDDLGKELMTRDIVTQGNVLRFPPTKQAKWTRFIQVKTNLSTQRDDCSPKKTSERKAKMK